MEVDKDILNVGETVTAYAKISAGAMVNYTWDWGDGTKDTTVRQGRNVADTHLISVVPESKHWKSSSKPSFTFVSFFVSQLF